jgi:hypothetical protein
VTVEGIELQVEQVSDSEWRLLRDLVWEGDSERFTVTKGFTTNFASVPRPFWWLIPRTGKYTWAVVLHDATWCDSQRPESERQVDPWDADGIFRRTLRESGVSQLRRYLMWAAVRLAAVANGRLGKQGPSQLLPLALIVIPSVVLLAPAAAVIVVSLGVFWVLEWLVLGLFGMKRNRPRLFWWSTDRTAGESGDRDCHLIVESLG